MDSWRVCWSLVLASIRGEMQYRFNFLIEVAFGLVYQSLGFVLIVTILGQFEPIGGWTLRDVTLLYAIRTMGQAIWALSFSGMLGIDEIIQQGEYDRMLIRPMPVMLQLMFGSFRVAVFGDLLGGVTLLTIALAISDVDWGPAKMAFLIAAMLGSAALVGAFQLGPAAMTFRFLSSSTLRAFFENLFAQFSGYPLNIFERKARSILTFIVPIAFVAWVPGAVLLDRTDSLPFPAWVAWCSPLFGVVVLVAAWWLFQRESRQYQSSGT
ncbi:MAG: ABC transporter permease [Thermomicrobiales bacterium]